jgi:GTP cyclohydrolase IA
MKECSMEKYEEGFAQLLVSLGENPHRNGLKDTPSRVLKALSELTEGYRENIDDEVRSSLISTLEFGGKGDSSQLIFNNIKVYSLCEHYLLPFFGTCTIGIHPHKSAIGLSKIQMIVNHFSKRLQLQERLTHDIGNYLMMLLDARGVFVKIEAQHCCMMMRGKNPSEASLMTSVSMGNVTD